MGAVTAIPGKLRWTGRAAYHSTVLRSHPRVLCNSLHKAGTHLLRGAVRAIPGLHDYGRSSYWHYLSRSRAGNIDPSATTAARKLSLCLPGEVMRGHIARNAEIEEVLESGGFKHIFIYRDPRDVVTSLFHWWNKRERGAYLPYRVFASLPTQQQQVAFLIEGVANGSTTPKVVYPDIGARFREFAGWLEDPSCLAVRFEDLVDPDGREQVCRMILHRVFPETANGPEGAFLKAMIDGMAPGTSKTFRKGSAGEWRTLFSPDHIELFKRHAGDVLVSLGYEKDDNWS